jgi:fatty-acyl-CoA synthase
LTDARSSSSRLIQHASGQSLSKDAVYVHCADHLASFKVPKDIVFAEALPRNPSGKLLKRELREKHASLFAQ